jgi:hypothetical protein
MMLCIHRTEDNVFFCSKYIGGSKVMGANWEFKTKEELKDFLLKLPSPPVSFIEDMVNNIE